MSGHRVIVYGPAGDLSSEDYGEHDIRYDRTFADLDELRLAGLAGIADHETPLADIMEPRPRGGCRGGSDRTSTRG